MTGRGLRGRRLARSMFLGTIAAIAFVAALAVLGPRTIGPIGVESSISSLGTVALASGIAGIAIGLAWMIRMLRSIDDVEAHAPFFRSRR
jgi:hypothetical protein